ncbi:hypothetical protein [Runella salmonicolor]|jgi:hypothetical protein|uniref:Uncharacterized protein n=1 Tax=Runella salmonicolor TaxID=2950278 RepID=A0ABT1FIF0_9BACT|nr:hypothetical protein [Runella salmonicolor]MCP1381540.1 hypothetical protein [Runella salmonicolor]
MKISSLLFIVVGGLTAYLFFTMAAIFQGNLDPCCNFWPTAECLEEQFKLLTSIQKCQLLDVVHLDYWYLICYPFLLGIWVYREMQAQILLWTNTLLRCCLLVLAILFLADITETILLEQLLKGITYPFKVIAIFTRLKWATLTFVLLILLISIIGRKTGLFPLSLRLKNRIE